MSDSDASTVDPDDLDDTIPLDPRELRKFNNSPDLFADYPVPAESEKKKMEKLTDKRKERSLEQKNNVEKASLKPTDSKTEKLVKRRSKVHELSDSGSDSDEKKNKSKISATKLSEFKQNLKRNKEAEMDQAHGKPYKKDYSSPFQSKSDAKVIDKDKVDKQKFINDFLNMADDETDEASNKKIKTDKKSKQSREQMDLKNVKDTKDVKHKQTKVQTKMLCDSDKKDSTGAKVKDSAAKTHEQTNGSIDSVSGPLKRKSSSSSPQTLKKSDTEILTKDKTANGKRTPKPPCKYGSKCYRKNPSHKAEFSHPVSDDEQPSTSTGRDSPTAKKVKVTEPPAKKAKTTEPPPAKKVKATEYPPAKIKATEPPPAKKIKATEPPPAKKVKAIEHLPVKSRSSSPEAKSLPRAPKTIGDKFSQAQPYSFFLTTVSGISDKYNSSFAMDIKEILSPEMGNITASCQFNYMFDVEWLMKQYPPPFRSKPVLLVHGEQGPSKAQLQAEAINYSNVKFCQVSMLRSELQAKLEMMFGTHHTKMMLLLYDNGLRVVIHTSNLIKQDWFQKTQGIWISPVFPKLQPPSKDKGDSPTHFKKDLIDYLAAYKAYQLQEWIEHLASHDMSQARVVIVGSVPGRHTTDKHRWGHTKLRKVLQEHGPSQTTVKSWPVIGQFSSIGSMGANKDQWLCGEWLESLSAAKSASGLQNKTKLQLVFPSKDNVRLSLEGFPAGGSIPYSVKTAQKQTWLHDFFHLWKSDQRGRSRAMPHIKTFLRPAQDGKQISWFIVTSANLSKAAWGAFEKKGAQLMIRSYEIGVLLLPKFFDKGEVFTAAEDITDASSLDHILLPYDLPPTAYRKGDRPWMWDIPYMDLPDTNGNIWCPFSK